MDLEQSNCVDKFECLKLMPWMSWDEWDSVRVSLYSASPPAVAAALARVAAWRSRGCLPAAIEATASFIEIRQKDLFFSMNSSSSFSESEELLAMLYSMAVMRLINGLVERTRRRDLSSITESADKIGMPRMLTDIRHEASHSEMPSLPLLRLASTEAINWLKSYYWDAQKNALPFKHSESANVMEEIWSTLRKVPTMRKKQSGVSSSSELKLFRKKDVDKIRHFYTFFPSECVSVLLEGLFGISDRVDEFPEKSPHSLKVGSNETGLDKWKYLITCLSDEQPDLLRSLLISVAEMIDAQRSLKDVGGDNFSLLLHDAANCQILVLSSLFNWLVDILKAKGPEKGSPVLSKSILLELLRRCLVISEPRNNELFDSALTLSLMTGDGQISERLKKLSLVFKSPTTDFAPVTLEEDIQRASSLHLPKEKVKRAEGGSRDSPQPNSGKWSIVESWKPCPIGLSPGFLVKSSCLPALECVCKREGSKELTPIGIEKLESRPSSGCKRGASSDMKEFNNTGAKKVRREGDDECNEAEEVNDEEDHRGSDDAPLGKFFKGELMMNGVLQKVGENELKKIQSGIRVLVKNPCRVKCGDRRR